MSIVAACRGVLVWWLLMKHLNKLYHFDLPQSLIAQTPAHPRDHAKLLVYRISDGSITDSVFYELDSFVHPKTTFAINNSKVEHCRWLFRDNKTEIFVIEKSDPYTIRAMVRPGRAFREGKITKLSEWLTAETLAIDAEGIRTIRLNIPHNDERIRQYEHVPLPPYIEQDDALAKEYQTVYAKPEGSLAAPTAGLHFTTELMTRLSGMHQFAEVTLHVGLGTFANLTDEHIKSNSLHSEKYLLDTQAARTLQESIHVTAVGTTTVRTLETIRRNSHDYIPTHGDTDIFIRPVFQFQAVDSMITNFHLPSTSLLMLVAAFIADKRGLSEQEAADELQRIYRHAIQKSYRFYSFGDAMLIV